MDVHVKAAPGLDNVRVHAGRLVETLVACVAVHDVHASGGCSNNVRVSRRHSFSIWGSHW